MVSKIKQKIFIILLLLLCVTPVAAVNMTYTQDYYTLGIVTNTEWNKIYGAYYGGGQDYPTSPYLAFLELRRQTILMEKQNELQAEFVKAQWVETCYAPKYTSGYNSEYHYAGNLSAWKSECVNAGYTVG
jgi:hypothetical protein